MDILKDYHWAENRQRLYTHKKIRLCASRGKHLSIWDLY